MKKNILKITLVITTFFVINACSDFLDEVNPNQPNEDGFFVSDVQAIQSLNSAYATLQTRGYYKRQYYPVELLSGDFVPTAGSNQQWRNLGGLVIEPTNPEIITTLWVESYKGIARANFVIENIGAMTDDQIDPALRARIVAEAHFLRGVFYFHLVTVYGDVPIIDHVINDANDPDFKPARDTEADVWAFIEGDFQTAVAGLPRFEDYTGADVGRASKGAAQGFLGKAYLYQEKWSDAASTFGALVNEPGTYGAYGLMGSYEENFLPTTENNTESLFEVHFLGGLGNVWAGDDTGGETESTYYGTEFNPYQFANVFPSDELNAFFDANTTGTDVRRMYTIAREGDLWGSDTVRVGDFNARIPNAGGNSGVRKHIDPLGSMPFLQSGNNFRLMRFADVLLMYAEALNESGASSTQVIAELNKVRGRAGADLLADGLSQAELRTAVKTERRLELTFECFRWFDVIRWGDADAEWAGRGWQSHFEHLPISQGDLLLNENLTQTAGY